MLLNLKVSFCWFLLHPCSQCWNAPMFSPWTFSQLIHLSVYPVPRFICSWLPNLHLSSLNVFLNSRIIHPTAYWILPCRESTEHLKRGISKPELLISTFELLLSVFPSSVNDNCNLTVTQAKNFSHSLSHLWQLVKSKKSWFINKSLWLHFQNLSRIQTILSLYNFSSSLLQQTSN